MTPPRSKRRSICALSFLFTIAALVFTSSVHASEALFERVNSMVRAELKEQELVGIAVGVIMDGRVVHTAGFGWEDREARIPVTDATMFRWASISKPVTAVVAMQLAREGKLDLDADVRRYVPEFPDPGHVITSRQLLGHQGGIVHYRNGPVVPTRREYDSPNPYASAILALDTFNRSPLVNEPGTAYAYTTHGYMLLGAVVERAGGDTYWNLVQQRITRPLGLTTLQPDYQWEEIPHRAVGYRRRGGRIVTSTNTDVSWKLAGGGFISTIHDLAGFGAGMLGDQILDADLKEQMWTRQSTRDGKLTVYGLGFRPSGEGDKMRVGHGGSQEKARTRLFVVPAHNVGVALMSNTHHAQLPNLTDAILDLLVEHEKAKSAPRRR